MSTERHRALRLLAGSPLGVTEAIMLAHGFTIEMLALLVRDGLAMRRPRPCTLASGRSRLSGCGSPMPDGWRWSDDGPANCAGTPSMWIPTQRGHPSPARSRAHQRGCNVPVEAAISALKLAVAALVFLAGAARAFFIWANF